MDRLSSCEQNILNWYPFKKESNVLEIGGNQGELTQLLADKCSNVITIEPNLENAKIIKERYGNKNNIEIITENFNNIKLEETFNYIVFIGNVGRIEEIMGQNENLSNLIQKLEKYLKNDGKFLIALDNKFGLRYFAGNPDNILNKKFKSLTGYSNEPQNIETFTKNRLQKIIQNIGFKANFYYPLPDYRMPNVIFSDKQLPEYNNIDKYVPYTMENSTIIMNEIDVFREILKDDKEMFTFFANSFFIELSREEQPIKYKYISFNNIRKKDYRLITKIADEYVEKQPVNDDANKHYEQIKQNIKYMMENNIKTLDYETEGRIQSKYISQDLLLNNVITKALENGDNELLEKVMGKYIEALNINTYHEENYENTLFAKYDIKTENPQIINNMHFLKSGLWDMTFKNCFYIENELYFFDQEWVEENLPAEYILYRSILYTISLRRFINIEDWLEKYNLTQYKEIFQKLDDKLQEKIRDKEMWEFYSQNKDFDIDATKQELINMTIRSNAQISAMENLQKEYKKYRDIQEQKLSHRIKRKIKTIIGRKQIDGK